LELDDVRAFQVHLVSTGISWPALNQIVCALRFFYGVTLGEALIPERIPYAREPRKLPVVLSANEVVQFLECVSAWNKDPAYCRMSECYPDGAIAQVDATSTDRPRQVVFPACSMRGAVGGSGPT
jgi:integrase